MSDWKPAPRPWSGMEAEEAAEKIAEALHEAVGWLPKYAQRAATSEHNYRMAAAIAYAEVKGSNQTERDHKAYRQMQANADEENGGEEAVHPRLRRDLDAAAYKDQRTIIMKLQNELDLARTLMVSARAVG